MNESNQRTVNLTSLLNAEYFDSSLKHLEFFKILNLISTCVLMCLGLFGHLLTIFVYSQARFRLNASNVYMLCLAINDALYLISHVNFNIFYFSSL
jgi:hypothetical protein